MMDLKVNAKFFPAIYSRVKKFEVRRVSEQRQFFLGMTLALHEWDDVKQEYTGRTEYRRVTYILEGPYPEAGLPAGTVVLGMEEVL